MLKSLFGRPRFHTTASRHSKRMAGAIRCTAGVSLMVDSFFSSKAANQPRGEALCGNFGAGPNSNFFDSSAACYRHVDRANHDSFGEVGSTSDHLLD